jgi:hypothetical protein
MCNAIRLVDLDPALGKVTTVWVNDALRLDPPFIVARLDPR